MKKMIVPANVSIKRFYRVYAYVDCDATYEEIRKAIIKQIIEGQDAELVEELDLSIEPQDIDYIGIDDEETWTEEEDEEITNILNQ